FVSHRLKWQRPPVLLSRAGIPSAIRSEPEAQRNPHSTITLQLDAQGAIVGEFLHGDAWEFTG
ncbi:MAG TPA: hypothetical protein PKW90_14245, partial [Myxococcota bacterium]|nr:hypothetical protein [Myxococcota bacterium]